MMLSMTLLCISLPIGKMSMMILPYCNNPRQNPKNLNRDSSRDALHMSIYVKGTSDENFPEFHPNIVSSFPLTLILSYRMG
jgi:hypothetical protein